ncbi:MAG: 2,3-bisphosphoglycerate-independent phosphoglycerate mutase [Methylobacillus sp.]|jgi:2,3-bisphosphoglycerate-independent phosphoglycerate mutase|nr:2,3-bisphosphoglycerate-independent phosphoglycerate mutase [Methylobacillus sp.]
MNATPVLLLILDGFGYSEKSTGNAIALAQKPNWDALWRDHPHTFINASEHSVGLPDGQMGNSEVGHLNIGAGRVLYQEFDRINRAIGDGDFFSNPVLTEAVNRAKETDHALHIFGLLSSGGVHSHEHHIHSMVNMAARHGLKKVYVHAFLDGRDTPPKSAEIFIKRMQDNCAHYGAGRIATMIGRFYAMDRDRRWPRIEAAYNLISCGKGEFHADTAAQGLEMAYARGETDEFVKATVIGEPVCVEDGDVIVYMNFRSDRARELTRAFLDENFEGFHRTRQPALGGFYTLTMYNKNELAAHVAFPPEVVRNTLGEYLGRLGLKQLRIAETEKYPHVTFFFNGGEEQPYPGEDRILVPSPQVATYDLQPEMSAFEVTDRLEEAILGKKYDAIICNYANADMVGHTGNLPAAIKAVEAVDRCIGRVVRAMQKIGGEVIITADHGNAECMEDLAHHQPHTQHTTNLVPFLYIGRPAHLAHTGALSDVAPSLLHMMGVPQPAEMTGHSLVEFTSVPTAVNL